MLPYLAALSIIKILRFRVWARPRCLKLLFLNGRKPETDLSTSPEAQHSESQTLLHVSFEIHNSKRRVMCL